MPYTKIAKTVEIGTGQGKCFEANGKKIAVFNVEGAYFAIDNTCTHKGGPLCDGELSGVDVTCPWHGAVFDVATGEVKKGPATTNVTSYKLRVTDDDIEVDV